MPYWSRSFGSCNTACRRAVRSREAIWPNSAWLARAAVTPSTTIFWPVSARSRICKTAFRMATTSGTAISARPRSIKPLNDLGRHHQRMGRHSTGAPAGSSLNCVAVALPGVALQALLPGVRGPHDSVEVIEARLPTELGTDALRLRHQRRRVARAARLLTHGELAARHPLDARQYLAHAVAVSVADIERGRGTAFTQPVEGVQVRRRQVLHVNVIAYSGAVGGRVIGAEYRHLWTPADRRLAGNFDQKRGVGRRLTDATAGVRAGHVEITQRRITQRRGLRNARQHPLRHQLGGTVGIDGRGR